MSHSRNRSEQVGWKWLLAICLVALAYRGICFYILHGHPLFAHPIVDASFHDAWARRIVCGDWLGHGPDDVFKPPLYPYFLATIYCAFGPHVHPVQWAQFLLGSVSCVLVAVLAGRWLGRTAGILAGFISALYAPYVFFELQLLTPAVSIFLNLTAMVLLTNVAPRGRLTKDLCAGAVLGLSAGMRPDVILPTILVVLYLVARESTASWHTSLARVSCIAATFCLAVLPITIRNYSITGEFLPISSNAGINFYVGNGAGADGTSAVPVGLHWERLVARVPQEVLERPTAASHWWRNAAWQEMRSQPGTVLARFAEKAAAFLNRREFRNNICYHFVQPSCWPMRIPLGQYSVILPLAVCGLVFLWYRRSEVGRAALAVCGLWLAGYWIMGILFFVTARFRLPAIPFLIIPAAWAVVRIAELIRNRRWQGLARCGLGVVAVAVVSWPMWFGAPKNSWARDYVNLGNSLRTAGRFQEAADAYRQALAISSDDPDANYLLARLLLPNDRAQALKHLNVARQVLPDSPDLLLTTAQAYGVSGDNDRAKQTLEQLDRLSTTSNLWPKRAAWATAHIMLAELQPAQAAAHWEQAWSIDPVTAAEASFLKRRDLDRVAEAFRAAAREKTWDWYSQANYGMVLLELSRADEAAEAFQNAAALAPERDALRFHLARALLKSGNQAEAHAILDQLERTLPDCPLRRDVRALRRQVATATTPAPRK